jgi:dolichol-phosphate mannosyltransferase
MPRQPTVTVIVPTFNEAPNVEELVARISATLNGRSAQILFVDDSTDETPNVIRAVAAATTSIDVRLLHRENAVGGLSGAVLAGLEASTSEWCVVMDGDLQHPPEIIPTLLSAGVDERAEIVVASRYVRGGSSDGLSNLARRLVSNSSNILTRAMFPIKLRNCTDPMTGFFAVKRDAIDLRTLRPRGFKILLEILARTPLTVAEIPFAFGDRKAGESKASLAQGLRFLTQLGALRFGRLSGFAAIGALGAVANLLIMGGLQSAGVWYVAAAIIAGFVTIVANFLLQERFVFHDLRSEGRNVWLRFGQSLAFNGTETLIRTAILWVIVERTTFPSVPVQAALLAIGFLLRFVYHSRIVYRPKRTTSISYDLDEAPTTSLVE